MRSIAPVYSITPATATTCGDGSGKFCRFCKWSLDGTATCYLFGELEERDGWLQRRPECIACELISR